MLVDVETLSRRGLSATAHDRACSLPRSMLALFFY